MKQGAGNTIYTSRTVAIDSKKKKLPGSCQIWNTTFLFRNRAVLAVKIQTFRLLTIHKVCPLFFWLEIARTIFFDKCQIVKRYLSPTVLTYFWHLWHGKTKLLCTVLMLILTFILVKLVGFRNCCLLPWRLPSVVVQINFL